MPLDHTRKKIDKLDQEILERLQERIKLVEQVFQLKKADPKILVRDKGREKAKLGEIAKLAREYGMDPYLVTRIFRDIIEYSVRHQAAEFLLGNKESQQPRRVAFQGILWSYSHLAAMKFFSDRAQGMEFFGFDSFRAAVEAVERGEADFAILPIENTIAGSINETYQLIGRAKLHIVGEEQWRIRHCLMGVSREPLGKIRRISSHPQALLQCSEFLSTMAGVIVESYVDTAAAARKVLNDGDPTQAAIASAEAAEQLGLSILKEDIGNQRENYTRFVLVAPRTMPSDPRLHHKVSMLLVTEHKEGALYMCLKTLNDHQVNMTKLESRPIPNAPWEYQFYLDVEGNLTEPHVQDAISDLRRQARYLKVLGCYPSCPDAVPEVAREALVDAPSPAPQATPIQVESQARFKLASRANHPEELRIKVGDHFIGPGTFTILAGPCTVRSADQVMEAARLAKEYGAHVLRGQTLAAQRTVDGFQGLGFEGLAYLAQAGKTYGLPIVTEVQTPEDVAQVAAKADILQIGTVNMQNFALLREVGATSKPVLLKRSMMASIDEWLSAAEFILSAGNGHVILCERGIRTFETATPATLDLSAVPILKARTHLPVVVDPSHATGHRELVGPMAKAAVLAGADGIMVEFETDPDNSVGHREQLLSPEAFQELVVQINALLPLVNRTIG